MKINFPIKHLLLTGALAADCMLTAHASTFTDSVKTTPNMHAIVETSRTAWWEKARFGMFIHWGVYSEIAGEYNGKTIPGLGEWIMHDARIPVATYREFAKSFNPTEYNPEQWVLMAKAAGMKYMVITTKHHDGFALFDSQASDWNVVKATPYGKDLIKPLADACRKYGMKLGFYYSQANDWNNKGGAVAGGPWDEAQKGSMDEYLDKVAVPQVKEILTKYGDVAELWWDVPTGMTKERAAKFAPLVAMQPNIITNDRLGGGVKGDLFTPEQYIPATGVSGLWETCMTMNDTWGFKEKDTHWKSSQQLIRNLIETSSKGGNYLLNVGPEATGKFPPAIVERLDAIGKWMKVNSESIYGTTASPFKVLPWGRATTKAEANGNTVLYLHVYNWPTDGRLVIPGLKNDIISATLLATGKKLITGLVDEDKYITVPTTALDENATVIKVLIKGKPDVVPYIQKQADDGTIALLPGLADMHTEKGGEAMRAEGGSEQNIGYWTDPKSSASWKFVVKKPGTYKIETSVASNNGTKIILKSGSEAVTVDVPATGDYGRYRKITPGTFKFDTPGTYTVSLSSATDNWNPVNIRKIVLSPAN